MNQKNLNDIFEHYIEKFEYINTEHGEYYKWQIAKRFRPMMDEALASSDDDFPKKLLNVRNLTENMIDSYLQPFYGLVKCAEIEPVTVRQLFLNLFQEDDGNLTKRNERIKAFLEGSHALRDEYFKDSYLYSDDYHSVTCYLALYDPNHNYILKQTQSRSFAECIEFYDDWGTGENVNLAKYYKMCDEVVEAIKQNEMLLKTDASRFDPRLGYGDLYPDKEKHLLTFDIIYCSSVYDLYSGVSIVKRTAQERIMYEERKKTARERKVALDEAYQEKEKFDSLCAVLETAFPVGTELTHTKLGNGEVIETKDGFITVQFSGKSAQTKLSLPMNFGNGLISLDEKTVSIPEDQKPILLEENRIKDKIQTAEKLFAPYADDLELKEKALKYPEIKQ